MKPGTSILDNLHPFLSLPSRASSAGAGGFSYYDHVCLPENGKDLVWLHAGRRFRSQVVIRSNGRRATDAFLFEAGADGQWRPVQLPDGTVSDGKTGTCTRCVESLLGSAETFFTCAFSAQGKRQLSTYHNSDIKTLLVDLLGQEEIRTEGRKAVQVVDLLKTALVTMRQQQGAFDEQMQRLDTERQRLADAGARLAAHAHTRQASQDALDAARTRLVEQRSAFE